MSREWVGSIGKLWWKRWNFSETNACSNLCSEYPKLQGLLIHVLWDWKFAVSGQLRGRDFVVCVLLSVFCCLCFVVCVLLEVFRTCSVFRLSFCWVVNLVLWEVLHVVFERLLREASWDAILEILRCSSNAQLCWSRFLLVTFLRTFDALALFTSLLLLLRGCQYWESSSCYSWGFFVVWNPLPLNSTQCDESVE